MADRVPLYDDFGERYDLMVEWEGRLARESPFFESIFQQTSAGSVLDVGCGTGWHAIHFARLGLQVTAVDPSGEMLRLAEANGASGAGVRLVQAGLGQLAERTRGEFGVVTCLGNTLPHLLTPDSLLAGLRDARDVLRPGGVLVVQQLNYDRILAQRQRFLGVSSRTSPEAEHLFFRFYDYGEPLITFNMVSFERPLDRAKGGWEYRVDSTSLQPITAGQVESALAAAGFAPAALYGSYDRQPFDSERSNDLIVVAARQ